MSQRNVLVEDIFDLLEGSAELDELVRFNPKAPAGVKADKKDLRKGQADAVKAMRGRLRKDKYKDPEDKEADKYRLGQALKGAGATKGVAKLGQGAHKDHKKPPEHEEPEHHRLGREAEKASGQAHDDDSAHKKSLARHQGSTSHDDSDDDHDPEGDAFTATHSHLSAVKAHHAAMKAAEKAKDHQRVQHHSREIQRHVKAGRESQSWHQNISKDKETAAKRKEVAEMSSEFDRFDSLTEQRRLMGLHTEPVEKREVAGSLQEMLGIVRSDVWSQRDLMGLENPYPTLQESRQTEAAYFHKGAGGGPQKVRVDAPAETELEKPKKKGDLGSISFTSMLHKPGQKPHIEAVKTKAAALKRLARDKFQSEMKLGVAGRMGGDAPMDSDEGKPKKKQMPTWLKRKLPGRQD